LGNGTAPIPVSLASTGPAAASAAPAVASSPLAQTGASLALEMLAALLALAAGVVLTGLARRQRRTARRASSGR
jgi:hypothetical protein